MAGSSASSGGGQGAIKAGQAFVGLALNDSDFVKGLEKAKKFLKNFASYAVTSGKIIGAGGAAITGPLLKFLYDAADRGSSLKMLADRFGSTVEEVSTLSTGFERAGVSLEEFGGIIDGLEGRIKSAADGNNELIEGLRGLNGRTLEGKGVSEQLEIIAERFKDIKDAKTQAVVANDLGLSKILPQLKKGAAGIRELRDAGKLGFMDAAQAERSKELTLAFTEAWQSLKYTAMELGAALLPTSEQIRTVVGWIRKGTDVTKTFIKNNKLLVGVIFGVGVALVGAGVALLAFGLIASTVGTAIAGITAIVTAFGVVADFVFAPIVLPILGIVAAVAVLTAALGALGYVFFTQTEIGQEMWAKFEMATQGYADTFKKTWGGIIEALSDGDFELAGDIAMAGLNSVWKRGLLKLTELWVGFKKIFVDGWNDVVTGGRLVFLDFATWLSKLMIDTFRPVFKFLEEGLRAAGQDAAADKVGAISNLTDKDLDAERARQEAVIVQDRIKQQKEADAFRQAQLAAARDALTEAEADLERLVDKTRKSVGNFSNWLGIDFAKHAAAIDMPRLYEQSKGLFSGPVRQQLGYGDSTAKRQLDATMDIANNAKVLPEINHQVADLNKAMRFK